MKRVKLTSLILILSFVLTLAVPAYAAGGSPFTDVKTTRWSFGAIKYAVDSGYMKGVGDGKFDPAGSMTRGMFVTVLWRKERSPEVEYRPDFTDVKDGKYYSKAVIWAKDRGIVSGVTETAFDPNGKITREQLATMIYRYCTVNNLYVDERGDVSSFSDKGKIHSYASDAMSWAVEKKLISGVTKDTLDPRGLATREQVATILRRFDETEIMTLADYYRPYMEQMADHAEVMLREEIEWAKAHPDSFDFLNWDYGMLVIGLTEAGREDVVKDYVDLWLNSSHRDEILPCDPGLAGYGVLWLWEKTGDQKYADLAKEFLDSFDRWSTDPMGEITYGGPGSRDIYVDGTGMATPFLARYAADFGDEDVRRIAALQVTNYMKMGVDPARHLAYHGYTFGGTPMGELGWGRGTGWLMLAVGSVIRYCDDDNADKICDKFIGYTMKYLKPEYKFGWTLSPLEKDAPSDTSATGMIMWGVMQAKLKGLASSVSDETLRAIAKAGLTDVYDGVVKGSSGGAGGFGAYSEEYDENNGWGQGGLLSFYALFLRYLDGN